MAAECNVKVNQAIVIEERNMKYWILKKKHKQNYNSGPSGQFVGESAVVDQGGIRRVLLSEV